MFSEQRLHKWDFTRGRDTPTEPTQIIPQIYVSDCDVALCPAQIQKHGIRSILSLYKPYEGDTYHARSVRGLEVVEYHTNLAGTIHPELISAGLERVVLRELAEDSRNSVEALKAAVDTLRDLAGKTPPVLVHCAAGKTRAPSVIAVYLAQELKIDFSSAIKMVAQKHPVRLTSEFVESITSAHQLNFRW